MMIISIVAGTDNVTLEIVKKHLNISFPDDDSYLSSLINVSLDAVENYCRNSFIERTNEQDIGAFDGHLPYFLTTDLTSPPNDDTITIMYVSGGTADTLEVPKLSTYTFTGNFYEYVNGAIGIHLKDTITPDADTSVTLNWNTGQTDTMSDAILQARLLLIGNYYENRESVVTGMATNELPNGVQFLLDAELYPQVG